MNKTNIFKSSDFFMAVGDVLHLIIDDEAGITLTVGLAGSDTLSAPEPPIVLDATNVITTSFTANWQFIEGADGYYLDVAKDIGFTSFVTGFNNKSEGNVNSQSVAGLTQGTNYYYRVRAYNNIGTSISSDTIATKTTAAADLKDKDGNIYTTVTIGTQIWTVENLKVTKYADGSAIPNLILAADWDNTLDGAYCWYNNDIANKTDYGALYNGLTISNAHGLAYFERGGVQEIGWRVPTRADLITLSNYLGGDSLAGNALREVGISHWDDGVGTNIGATNSSGFTARGEGYRYYGSYFALQKATSTPWTSTEQAPGVLYIRNIQVSNPNFGETYTINVFGHSVRCVKDV